MKNEIKRAKLIKICKDRHYHILTEKCNDPITNEVLKEEEIRVVGVKFWMMPCKDCGTFIEVSND